MDDFTYSKCFGHEEESNLSVNDLYLKKVNSERESSKSFRYEESSNRSFTKEKEIQNPARKMQNNMSCTKHKIRRQWLIKSEKSKQV